MFFAPLILSFLQLQFTLSNAAPPRSRPIPKHGWLLPLASVFFATKL